MTSKLDSVRTVVLSRSFYHCYFCQQIEGFSQIVRSENNDQRQSDTPKFLGHLDVVHNFEIALVEQTDRHR